MSKLDFVSACIQGKAILPQIDAYIERWHEGVEGGNQELFEYLGMTSAEYGLWIKNSTILPYIVLARKNHITIEAAMEQYASMGMAARAPTNDIADKMKKWVEKRVKKNV